MYGSRAMGAWLPAAILSLVGLALTGCSSDDGAALVPGTSAQESSFGSSAPAVPSGLSIEKANERGFALVWAANLEPDLAGYRVYVYNPSPFREESYLCPHSPSLIPAGTTRYAYTEDLSWGTHYFKVAAVDFDGNESALAGPLEFNYSGPANPREADAGEVGGDSPVLPGDPGPGGWNPGRDEADQRK